MSFESSDDVQQLRCKPPVTGYKTNHPAVEVLIY